MKDFIRPRIYSQPLQKIYGLLEEKDDSILWDLFYKLANDELTSGEVEDKQGVILAKLESQYVESLDDLLRVCNVDLSEHIYVDHRIKTSQTPMKLKVKAGEDKDGNPIYEHKPTKIQAFHLQAKFKRKVPEGGIDKAFDSFVKKAEKHAPEYNVKRIAPKKRSKFAVNSIYDLHVGKLAWAAETGANYDTKIAIERFNKAFMNLGVYALDNGCDEIVIPLGNDLINIDNAEGGTSAGTPQDIDSRWQYMIAKTEEAFIKGIDYLSQYARIRVLYVPGNHDEMFSYFITKFLKAWYRNNVNVVVDDSPTLTKYYQNESVLIAFNHFKDIKPEALVQLISTNVPMMWAQSWYREAHGGHFHTKKVKGVKVDTHESEDKGLLYRVLPSLCETDAWHKRKGYDGNVKAAQVLIYDKQLGFDTMKQFNWKE